MVINSTPTGATVFINGKEVGQTPQQLEYPVGRYVVVAEFGRLYHPARQEVSLTRKGARVTLDLKQAFGSAKITSSPSGAEVWLDGERVGNTPHIIPQKVSGTYQLRLQLADYLPIEAELVINDGKVSTHHGELVANWGKISIKSTPPGATVYLDDVLVPNAQTPCVLDRVKPGLHIIRFDLPGHGERSEKTDVVRGKTASVSTELQPMLGLLVVTSSYADGSKCEGDLKIDGQLVGQTPWLGDVLAAPHTVEVQCPKGKGKQQVVVTHNSRSDVNIKIEKGVGEWVLIPGGSFNMGSNNGESDEKPVHRVTVRTFEMTKTQVTVEQYKACVDAGACTAPDTGGSCNWGQSDRGKHPINCVDWHQAQAYAKWAGGRLPSEAEWEYAARSGGRDWKYPWGNGNATCERAVMYDGDLGCGRESTWPVCSKPRGNTTHGLCDMAGNVWEWVQDWYHDSYKGAPTDGSAWEKPTGSIRVNRGGSWYRYAGTCGQRSQLRRSAAATPWDRLAGRALDSGLGPWALALRPCWPGDKQRRRQWPTGAPSGVCWMVEFEIVFFASPSPLRNHAAGSGSGPRSCSIL